MAIPCHQRTGSMRRNPQFASLCFRRPGCRGRIPRRHWSVGSPAFSRPKAAEQFLQSAQIPATTRWTRPRPPGQAWPARASSRGRSGLPVQDRPRAVASAMRSSVKAGEAARTMRGAPGDERRSRFRALDPMERAGRFHASCPGAGRLRRRPVRSSRPRSACGWCSSHRPIPPPRSWWLPWSRIPRASAARIPAWSGRNSMAARC
jgi:hypothetical protein